LIRAASAFSPWGYDLQEDNQGTQSRA
jgi:hypothetical protein